jgi:hypothetical protein
MYSDISTWIPNIYQLNSIILSTTINVSDTTNLYIGIYDIKITNKQHLDFIQLKLPSGVVSNNSLTTLLMYINSFGS